MKNEFAHIGDGVYVRFDGYGIEMRANSHEHPTDVIYLEPGVYHALTKWVESLKGEADATAETKA